MKRLLFLLSGNLSTTPRALKSIHTAIQQGYEVDLYLVNRLDKWKNLDENILSSLICNVNYVPFRKDDGMLLWFYTSLLQKICLLLSIFMKNNMTVSAFASSKINILYYHVLKNVKTHYDLVIGYSGMYYPAFLYSEKNNVPFAFDMEDYHPGEVIYHFDKESEINRRIQLFKNILPKATYVSYASPLIREKTETLLAHMGVKSPKGLTVNNTFRHSDFELSFCHDDKVKFVWFSQTISYGRGIELILPILNKYKKYVSLTLIGNMDDNFYRDILSNYEDILLIKGTMAQDELHKEIGKYDIGLAIEQNVDENKSICLSNKIFTYLLSGLYIIATSTKAQKQLMSKYPTHGVVVDSVADDMEKCVCGIINGIQSIRDAKMDRFRNISSISWETEEKELLNVWSMILG